MGFEVLIDAFFRKSLNLTSALATATEKGYKVILESPDGKERQELLIL